MDIDTLGSTKQENLGKICPIKVKTFKMNKESEK